MGEKSCDRVRKPLTIHEREGEIGDQHTNHGSGEGDIVQRGEIETKRASGETRYLIATTLSGTMHSESAAEEEFHLSFKLSSTDFFVKYMRSVVDRPHVSSKTRDEYVDLPRSMFICIVNSRRSLAGDLVDFVRDHRGE